MKKIKIIIATMFVLIMLFNLTAVMSFGAEDGKITTTVLPQNDFKVVEKAHRDGAKVYVALGGWSYEGKPLVGLLRKSDQMIS